MMRRLLAASLVLLGSVASARGQEPRNTHSRSIEAGGTGPRRLAVDAPLLASGSPFRVVRRGDRVVAADGLKDLRLVDASGNPVPYILVHEASDPAWRSGRVLPVAPTKTTSGFEVDFGAARTIDRVRIAGLPAPFLKRLRVEGSGDRERWTLLQGEATLFDLPDERIANTEVPFTPGTYRYVRVTWNDTNSGRVPPPRVVSARDTASVAAPLPTSDVSFDRRPSEPGRSRYRIKLPAAALPVVALDLEVGNTYVHRNATVSESRFTGTEAGPAPLGSARLVRVLQAGVAAESLLIPVTAPTEPEIDLVVEDGDNPPLDLKRVRLVFAELPWVYFEAPTPSLVARFGDRNATAPRYDLEAARASVDLAHVPEAHWEDVTTTTAAEAPAGEIPEGVSAGAAMSGDFRHVRDVSIPEKGGLVALALDPAALSHSQGPGGRFADVRVLTADNRQVPYLIERRDEPLSVDVSLHGEPAASLPLPASAGSRSIYRIALPQSGLPPSMLIVETSARVFHRTAQLGVLREPDRAHRDRWFDVLTMQAWEHAQAQESAPALSLRLPTVDHAEVWLVVDEGDNAALPLTAARLLLPSYRLRFFAPPNAAVRLAYGRNDLETPRYDLALLAPRVMGASPVEVTAKGETGTSAERAFVSPLWFGILVGISALVLVGIIVRLARRA